MRCFNSGVISLVRSIKRSHSFLAFFFDDDVCSLSSARKTGILNPVLSTGRTTKKRTVYTRHISKLVFEDNTATINNN